MDSTGRLHASGTSIFFPHKDLAERLIMGQIFVFLSLGAILLTFYLSVFTKVIFNNESPYEEGSNPDRILVPIVVVTALLVMVGMLTIQPYRDHITPFVSSLLVLYSIFIAITAVILSSRYSEYLLKKSFIPQHHGGLRTWLKSKFDEGITGVLYLVAVVIVTCGLWFFGQNNYRLSGFRHCFHRSSGGRHTWNHGAAVQGCRQSSLHQTKTSSSSWKNTHRTLAPNPPDTRSLHPHSQWELLHVDPRSNPHCVAHSACPTSIAERQPNWVDRFVDRLRERDANSSLDYTVHTRSLTQGLRARLCQPDWLEGNRAFNCRWNHWSNNLLPVDRLVLCRLFAFNGHNNEVGGTARIEEFKQFIRFRLTKEGLTGFVIAVDDVSMIDKDDGKGRKMDGSDLKPKLIDVFHLVPKSTALTPKD